MLIATPRNGAKDWNNNIVDTPLPGRVADLFGITVEEYTGLPGGEVCDAVLLSRKVFFKARNWMEKLVAEDAEVIAEYGSGIYRSNPAATMKRFGKGIAIYVGTFASTEFHDELTDWLMRMGFAEEVLPSTSGVEATRRRGEGKEVVFLLNHKEEAVEQNLGGRVFRDLVSGDRLSGTVRIGALDFKAVAPG